MQIKISKSNVKFVAATQCEEAKLVVVNVVCKVAIHEVPVSNRIVVASTQFERPFDYSTSTWSRHNDCAKNVTKFRQPVTRDATFYRDVNVAIRKDGGGPFRYFLTSIDNPPYIRLSIPG